MSVRLTRSNFNGPTLHSKLLKKDAEPAIAQKNKPTAIMNIPEDIHIFAPPESSDEEESCTILPHPSETATKRKRGEEDTSQAKRLKPSGQPTRKSGRSRGGLDSHLAQEPQSSSTDPVGLFVSFDDPASSQSSQRRKQKFTYGKQSQSSIIRSSPSSNAQISVPKDPSFDSSQSKRKGFVNPTTSPSRSFVLSPPKKLKQPPVEKSESSQPPTVQFSLPDDPTPDDSGSSSLSHDNKDAGVFDIDDLPEPTPRSRRASTSSLSSLDSVASAYLSQSQKDDLRNGVESSQDLSSGYVQCPICKARVSRPVPPKSSRSKSKSRPLTLPSSPSKLSLRAQQAFCHTHKLATAKLQWIERNYPKIDWDHLETHRIPTHTDHLRKVLFRKTPSLYLDHLDAAVKGAKGNTRKLNAYLIHQHNGRFAPPHQSSSSSSNNNKNDNKSSSQPASSETQAYYGPRGANLMARAIATHLSKPIRHTLKSDATVSAAGVAGFISAVLAPELCLRLVMEDLKSKDRVDGTDVEVGRPEDGDEEEAARIVMRHSGEVGMLVWPDDESISDGDEGDGDGEED